MRPGRAGLASRSTGICSRNSTCQFHKADVEIEGLLLEVLGDFQITVPELGTIAATTRPFVVLTSNATRELSEALRRRCLFLHIDFPEPELEERIVRLQVPGLDETLVTSAVRVVNALRALPLRKAPSIAETIDWAPRCSRSAPTSSTTMSSTRASASS